MTKVQSSALGLIVKGILAGIVYIVGVVVTGMVTTALHVHLATFDQPGTKPHMLELLFSLATPLIGLCLVPLARHTGGPRWVRGLALGFLVFMCLGLTSVLEARIFLTMYAHGGALAAVLSVIPPAFLCGLALSFLLGREEADGSASQRMRTFFAAHGPMSWVVRFALAILAFGVAYLLFGMMVAPFVVPYYKAGVLGLTLPPFSTIIPVLFVRSILFLLACLPFLILWTRSRGLLILSLGLAHWFLTGGWGMLMVYYWPTVMRVGHGLEIAADSFAYAAALAYLLMPRQPRNTVSSTAQVAQVFPS